MEIGKLYQIKKYFWLLYPSEDIDANWDALRPVDDDGAYWSDYFSKKFNCNITYLSLNTIFFSC